MFRPTLPQLTLVFQSTLSVRRATQPVIISLNGGEFQSTLSVRRATEARPIRLLGILISIHALRKESDSGGSRDAAGHADFNPRSP